jgi:hypothetical protein
MLFMGSDNWSLLSRPLRFGSVHVLWGKPLGKMIRGDGTIAADRVAEIERTLAAALPPA